MIAISAIFKFQGIKYGTTIKIINVNLIIYVKKNSSHQI